MSLSASGLTFAVGGKRLLQAVDLRVEPGQVHALLGPNGAGKSTLLKLLCGDLPPAAGTIELNGRALAAWGAGERARQRSVLPQTDTLTFGFTAEQVVALGRLPCPRQRPARERAIVLEALTLAGVAHLAERKYPTLSGGERARVQLARVLAQIWEPVELGHRYLLLDEPTASLDLAHQHEVLGMVRDFAAGGVGVLAILHDPNLALRYADAVTLLKDGSRLAAGAARAVLTAANIEALYGIPVDLVPAPAGGAPVIAVRPPAPARSAA